MSTETEHSATLGALAKALAAAQAKIEDAKKDSVNPFFAKKDDARAGRFASLASVRAAITPMLSANNLAIVQTTEPHGEAGVCVVTTLVHESGEWMRGRLFVPVSKKDAQAFGSAVSYARRYALAAIVNIATDDDDDGNVASKPDTKPETKKEEAKGPPTPAAVDVEALIKALADSKDAGQLSAASLAVGRARDKMTPADIQRARETHDRVMREIEGSRAA